MTRRECMRLLASTPAVAAPLAAQSSGRRPNFIFILCDDLGWGDLPAYGHRNVDAHGGWTVRGASQDASSRSDGQRRDAFQSVLCRFWSLLA